MTAIPARLPGRYASVLVDGLVRFLASPRLRATDHTVMLAIIADMDYFNIARVDVKALVEQLDMDARTVRGSISRLAGDGWMVVDRERNGVSDYLVDPGLAWKGQASRHAPVSRHFGRLLYPEQTPAPVLALEDFGDGSELVDVQTGELLKT